MQQQLEQRFGPLSAKSVVSSEESELVYTDTTFTPPSAPIHSVLLLLVLALAGSACRGDSSGPTGKQTGAPITPAAKPTAPAATSELSETDARALVDAWLAAQNAGNFDRYDALYAERFEGVKRVGVRSERFDRKGWMRDRRRMFARPMHVEASQVVITTSTATASARFTQRWSSATFEDRGPKELRLIKTADGPRIAGEILLASEVARAGVAAELEASDLRPVVHTRTTYVVLSREGNDEQALGEPLLDSDVGGTMAVRKTARPEKLPDAVKAAQGLRVRLYGAAGVVCRAKLGEISLLRRVTPHFGAVQVWTGSDLVDGEKHPPIPLAEVARDVWQEASELTLVVAALEDVTGECKQALWARDDARADAPVFSPVPIENELQQQLLVAVRKLPAYRKLASKYEAHRSATQDEAARTSDWEHYDRNEPLYSAWQNGQRTFVSFAVDVGGCSDFGGSLWALYEVRGSKLSLLNHPGSNDEPASLEVGTLFDANLDGAPEVLGLGWNNAEREANVLLRGTKNGVQFVHDIAPPFHDCGC